MEDYAEIKAKYEAKEGVLKALLSLITTAGTTTGDWAKKQFEDLVKDLK